MKSRTSFFNKSLLRKDIVRFAPAWALYGAYLLLNYGGSALVGEPYFLAGKLGYSAWGGVILNMLYALLCAQLLFGDLFKSRMCNGLHALPIRREGWFTTHLLAGLAFNIIPVMTTGLLILPSLEGYWAAGLLWMAFMTLQFVVFFGIAVFSMILAGSRFAAVTVYGVLTFFSAIILLLFESLYAPFLYGVVTGDGLLALCPVLGQVGYELIEVKRNVGVAISSGWGALIAWAVVGVAFLGAALALYRIRPLEKAGDFIIFKPVSWVFLVIYTLFIGLIFYFIGGVGTTGGVTFLIFGLAVGFFTGRMLLERTIRVFRGKNLIGFCTMVVVVAVSLLLTIWDIAGITRWVPEEKDVEWVSVQLYSSGDAEDYAITDPQVIREVFSIHQYGVDHPEVDYDYESKSEVCITYRLKNGQTVQRAYYMEESGTSNWKTVERVISRPESVFGTAHATVDTLLPEVYRVSLSGLCVADIIDKEEVRGLVEALIADAKEGNATYYHSNIISNHEWVYLTIHLEEESKDGYSYYKKYRFLCTEESVNVMAWVKENIK